MMGERQTESLTMWENEMCDAEELSCIEREACDLFPFEIILQKEFSWQ